VIFGDFWQDNGSFFLELMFFHKLADIWLINTNCFANSFG
jgi:hypothetical protein